MSFAPCGRDSPSQLPLRLLVKTRKECEDAHTIGEQLGNSFLFPSIPFNDLALPSVPCKSLKLLVFGSMAWKRSSVRSRPGPPTSLMPVVYILQSETTQRFYIGCTANVQARVAEHQRGQTTSTRGRGPWLLVYQEQFATLAEARQRERQLKSWKSHRSLRELIQASKAQG